MSIHARGQAVTLQVGVPGDGVAAQRLLQGRASLLQRDPRCLPEEVKATGERPRSLLSGVTCPGVCVECLPEDMVSCGKMEHFVKSLNLFLMDDDSTCKF